MLGCGVLFGRNQLAQFGEQSACLGRQNSTERRAVWISGKVFVEEPIDERTARLGEAPFIDEQLAEGPSGMASPRLHGRAQVGTRDKPYLPGKHAVQ